MQWELANLVRMAEKSGLDDGPTHRYHGVRFQWNVEPTSESIYMVDLQRRIAVAVDHLAGQHLHIEAADDLWEVYSNGLGDEMYIPYLYRPDLYRTLIEYKAAPDDQRYVEDLAKWESLW